MKRYMKGINKKIFSVAVVAILAISSTFLFVACKGDKTRATTSENGSTLSKAEIEAMSKSNKDLQNKIDELRAAKNKLETEKENLNGTIANLEGSNQVLKEQIAEYKANNKTYKQIGHMQINNDGNIIFKLDYANITPVDFLFATVLDSNGNQYPEDLQKIIIGLINVDFEEDVLNTETEYSVKTLYQIRKPKDYLGYNQPEGEPESINYYFNISSKYHGTKLVELMTGAKLVRSIKNETKKFLDKESRRVLFELFENSNVPDYRNKLSPEDFIRAGYKMIPVVAGDTPYLKQEEVDRAIADIDSLTLYNRVFIILPPLVA